MALTPNDNSSFGPTQGILQVRWSGRGKLKRNSKHQRASKFLYDPNVYHNNYGNAFGAYGGVPKMGVDLGSLGESVTLTSSAN